MKKSELKRNKPLRSNRSLKSSYGPKRKSRMKHFSGKDRQWTPELKAYIRERDGWCQVCGRPIDEIHHVIGRGRYKVHPEWYTLTHVHDERNLMGICTACHRRATDNEDEIRRLIALQEYRFGPLLTASGQAHQEYVLTRR